MIEFTLPIILQIVQTVGILVGIVYYITIMRNTMRARMIQVSTQFSSVWTRNEFVYNFIDAAYLQDFATFDEWSEKYGFRADAEATTRLFSIANMYNSAGHMVKDGLVKPEFVWSVFAPFSVILLWEKFKPLIDRWRELDNDPLMLDSFEFLYNVTKRRFPQVMT